MKDEQLDSALALKDEFLAKLGLDNPLGSMVAACSILSDLQEQYPRLTESLNEAKKHIIIAAKLSAYTG